MDIYDFLMYIADCKKCKNDKHSDFKVDFLGVIVSIKLCTKHDELYEKITKGELNGI
jgi:hypothetical protein